MRPKTRQALMEFQRSKEISPGGQLDSDAMAALQVDESSGSSSSTGGSTSESTSDASSGTSDGASSSSR